MLPRLALPMAIIIILVLCIVKSTKSWEIDKPDQKYFEPCEGVKNIGVWFKFGLDTDYENQYEVELNMELPVLTLVKLKLNSDASIILSQKLARITADKDTFYIKFYSHSTYFSFTVKGLIHGVVPYFQNIIINGDEFCPKPIVGYLDTYILGYKNIAETHLSTPNDNICGKRKEDYTPLIVNGYKTKPGDWPWHAAIYKQTKNVIEYQCGGTLISKTLVLSAAHCVTVRGVPLLPEILSVVLGQFELAVKDDFIQQRDVYAVIVHEGYKPYINLDNDIALILLSIEASFDYYVQPACLWHRNTYQRYPSADVYGTVVGWGVDQHESLSKQLRQMLMPMIPEATCIRSNPKFYGKHLTGGKFCAGAANRSACNGDSGGGFFIFVPDKTKDNSLNAPGAWYLRGIVSMTVSRQDSNLCDPTQYVVFTDIDKFNGWIRSHVDDLHALYIPGRQASLEKSSYLLLLTQFLIYFVVKY